MMAKVPKFKYLQILIETPKNVSEGEETGLFMVVKFNRPERKNAICPEMYEEITAALKYAENEELIRVVILTGNGDYYCSGNDLSTFSKPNTSIEEELRKGGLNLTSFVETFIDFSKILIACVNGPAIGIAVTTLAHCDYVYCNETATFNTPFVSLAQTPEACSSYLFPLLMGGVKANEVLISVKKLSAQEAVECRLAGKIIPKDQLLPQVYKMAELLANLPPQALFEAKKLIKNEEYKKKLKEINTREVKVLLERWSSSEFMQAIMNFMTRKQPKAKL